jgi:teichuronic acid biosynthesis glycosyltransferase TuaC
MRILTFSSLFPSSVEPSHGIFVYRRATHIAKIPGVELEAIAPVPFVPRSITARRWKKFSAIPESEKIGNVQVHHPRYPLLPKISMPLHGLLMFLGALRLARRLHRQNPFDCIDAHYVYPDGFAAVLLGKLLRIPVIVWALGTDINLFSSLRMIRPLIRWTLRNAAEVVTVSNALKARVLELGLPENKVRFIGNGVETELFRMLPREEARRALGIPEQAKVLVCVGALREAKGQQHIIAALAKLVSRHPELRLYLVGEGENRHNLERIIRQSSLKDRVVLAGARSNNEIPLWFNAADASILASSREGWPNVILESLACGTPVIATAVGQVPEILGAGDLGMLAEQDPVLLASAIETVLRRNWDRKSLERFAHARPWTAVAVEYEILLEGMVGRSATERSAFA